MAALPEQVLRVRLLEITRADFRRRDLGGDCEHRQARAVAVEQAVDEMQVAGPAAACADRELTGEMGFAGGGKRRDFLVPDMNPFDLALMAQRVGQPVETVADDAVNALDSRREKNLGELIRYSLCHGSFPFLPQPKARAGLGTPGLGMSVQTFCRCSTAAVSARTRRDSAASSISDSP
jgi:hypothetical protein